MLGYCGRGVKESCGGRTGSLVYSPWSNPWVQGSNGSGVQRSSGQTAAQKCPSAQVRGGDRGQSARLSIPLSPSPSLPAPADFWCQLSVELRNSDLSSPGILLSYSTVRRCSTKTSATRRAPASFRCEPSIVNSRPGRWAKDAWMSMCRQPASSLSRLTISVARPSG